MRYNIHSHKKIRNHDHNILKLRNNFSTGLINHKENGTEDIHKEKAPSNKTPALTESINMGIWVVGTSSQLFIRGS